MKFIFSSTIAIFSIIFAFLSPTFAQALVRVKLEKNRLAIGESTSILLESHFPEHRSASVSFDVNEGSAKGTFSACLTLVRVDI